MRHFFLALIVMLLLLSHQPAWALDHDNLDKNRPVQLEDAYPIELSSIHEQTLNLHLALEAAFKDMFPF